MQRLYKARHLVPVASPPIEAGAVLVDDGSVVQIGKASDLAAELGPEVEVRDLGDVMLMPGWVNPHTHIELSALGGDRRPPGGDYVRWVGALLEARAALDPDQARSASEDALTYLQSRGTVAVGDLANELWIGPLLARSELSGVLFHEIYGLQSDRAEALLEAAAKAMTTLEEDRDWQRAASRWTLALTPHAPQTCSPSLIRALIGRSVASREPLSIHVAESLAEVAFLAEGRGELADLLRTRGQLHPDWKPPGESPVAWLHRLGFWHKRSIAVHAVHLDRQDRSLLQSHGSYVVTCPRSNEYLDVGTAPIPELMRQGIPIALGTDSLASAPDLDSFAELAALLRIHPSIRPAAGLRMGTLHGAEALGIDARYGSIAPGRSARMFAVPLRDEAARTAPLETLAQPPGEIFPVDQAPWEKGH